MTNFFIESAVFEHDMLSQIDHIFIEFEEGYMLDNGEYLISEAAQKSEGLFTKLLNMIKSMLASIKKFFMGSDEKKDASVKKMEQELEANPDLKNVKKEVIDPKKIRKLTKDDFKRGAKIVGACLISMSIPTAIGLYKSNHYKTESQKLEGEINKLKRKIEKKEKDIKEWKAYANDNEDYMDLSIKQKTKIDNQNKEIDKLKSENNEKQNKINKNKEDIKKLTEELNIVNQQLELLKKSKQQVDQLATGKVVKDDIKSNTNSSKNSPKEIREVNKIIYKMINEGKTIYGYCGKYKDINKSIDTIKNDMFNIITSGKISFSDISDEDVKNNSRKSQILNCFNRIKELREDIKKYNLSNSELKNIINDDYRNYSNRDWYKNNSPKNQ